MNPVQEAHTSAPAPVTAAAPVNAAAPVTAAPVNTVATDWFNVRSTQFGAVGNRTTDDTAAFQAALNAVAAAGGGLLYVPAGTYKITSDLVYASDAALTILGDGPAVSALCMNSAADSFSAVNVSNAARFSMRDVSVLVDASAPSFACGWAGVTLTGIAWASFDRVAMQTGTAPNRVNQGIVTNDCTNVDIDNCDIRAYVNPVHVTGHSQVVTVRGSALGANPGSGVSTAAGVLVDGTVQTLHLNGVVINGGDRGVLWSGAGGANPAFAFLNDVEVNNPVICGLDFETGAEVWASQVWLSVLKPTGVEHGWIFGPSFQGAAYLSQCTFQGFSGHSLWIEGGSGYILGQCTFGQLAPPKAAADSYDEIHVGASAGNVTIGNCHFNIDPYMGANKTPPRSAVYVEAGDARVILNGSHGAGHAAYGTAAVIDLTGAMVRSGNVGLGLGEAQTAPSGGPVTGTAFADLMPAFTIPPYDPAVAAVYRLTAWGHGTEAAGTPAGLTVQAALNGNSLGPIAIVATPSAGSGFAWKYEAYLTVTATGTAGALNLTDFFTVAGVPVPHTSNGVAVNTTEANTLALQAQWSAPAGAPEITCDGCTLERIPNATAS